MEEHDRRRQEIMQELAERFKNSSEVMRLIARRIGEAAKIHNANRRRLEDASAPLRKCVDVHSGPVPFSNRELMEFSVDEFERFRSLAPITDEEVKNVDWDALSKGLLD